MGVAVQHSLDIQRAEAFFHQSFGCLHIFPAHQHVKDDPAVVSADEGRIGHIKPAYLIYAVANLIQSGFCVELRIPPQAWVDRIRRIAAQVAVAWQIPCRRSVIVVDDRFFCVVQHSALSIAKFPPVGKIQLAVPFRILLGSQGRCILCCSRFRRVAENIGNKIQTVFRLTSGCMSRQGYSARQHCGG